MTKKSKEPHTGAESELENRLLMSRRRFARVLLGGAAGAYAVPLIASFSMEGLMIGSAHAAIPRGFFHASNQGRDNIYENFPFLSANQFPGQGLDPHRYK
jgi:hypothetical protein